MRKIKQNKQPAKHVSHGEPIRTVLTDGSTVYDCPCGYGFENEREAMLGQSYPEWSVGAR